MRASTRAQNEHPHASLSGSALRSHAFALSLLSTASAPRCRLRLRRQQHCCQNDRHSRGAATAAAAALPRTATATRHRPGPPFSAPTALPPPPPQLPPPGEQSRGATAGTIVCFLNLPHSPCPKLPHITLSPTSRSQPHDAHAPRRGAAASRSQTAPLAARADQDLAALDCGGGVGRRAIASEMGGHFVQRCLGYRNPLLSFVALLFGRRDLQGSLLVFGAPSMSIPKTNPTELEVVVKIFFHPKSHEIST